MIKGSTFKKRFSFVMLMMLGQWAWSQNTVQGTITDEEEGAPIPGATVLVKGTTNGTITDLDGKYSIQANPEDVISISFVGFKTVEETVGSRTRIDVALGLDIEELSEVVVMGYSEKSRKELSAAVVTLDSKQMQSVTTPNLETMLQGKVAGLTVNSSSGAPGSTPDVRIRGINSINADRPPLVVVDGIIGGSYVPNDVESVNVLKDAAAIGLYGALGAGGVIIVTTKKGTTAKPQFTFSSRVGARQMTTGNFNLMNSQQLYDTQKQMWGDDEVGFLKARPEDLQKIDHDWLNTAFHKALLQNYTFTMKAKPGDLAYYFSLNYFDEAGTLLDTHYDRINLKSSVSYNPGKKFSFRNDINIQYNKSKTYDYNWLYDAFLYLPWDNPYDANGNPQYVDTKTPDVWYSRDRRNFMQSNEHDRIWSSGLDLMWSAVASYQVTDWLTLESRNRLSDNHSRYDNYVSPLTREGKSYNGTLSSSTGAGWSAISTNFARFGWSWGKHELNGFVAYEGKYYFNNSLSTSGRNLPLGIKVPDGSSVLISQGGYTTRTTYNSGISELDYSYGGKYFATVNFRADGSSLFAPGRRVGYFPSMSAAWLLSEESVFKNSWLDFWKIRGSYGYVGNDGNGNPDTGLGLFKYLPTYSLSSQYNNQPGAVPNNPISNKLGWETTRIINLGTDVTVLNGMFDLSVDAYQKYVDGMLFRNPLAYSTGYEYRWENIGSMTNSGLEISLSFNKSFGKLQYTSNFNIAFNRNRISKVTDVTDVQYVGSQVQQINQVDQKAFVWYMPKWKGVDPQTGNPLWEYQQTDANGNVTGTIDTTNYNAAQPQAIASAIPKYVGGWTNTFSYKGFTFSFLLSFQGGNMIYNRSRMFFDSDGAYTQYNMMQLQDGWSRWEKPGDIATHPRLIKNNTSLSNAVSSRYLEKGDYLRIRNIRLSYSFPSGFLNRVGFGDLSIYGSIDNLYTFTKFSGMDPDINLNNLPWQVPGTSDFKYPINKQFIMGLNVTF